MSGESVSAETFVWLVSGVDLCVAFKIVAADEVLVAFITFELAVSKVSLHVRLDIFFSAESALAV